MGFSFLRLFHSPFFVLLVQKKKLFLGKPNEVAKKGGIYNKTMLDNCRLNYKKIKGLNAL